MTIAMLAAAALMAQAAPGAPVPGAAPAAAPSAAVQAHLTAAQAAAGTRWAGRVANFCALDRPERPDPIASASPSAPVTPRLPSDWAAPPRKVFDNVYFVGSKLVSAFAIVTPDGIIITDGMGDVDVEASVVGGLRTLGLDPAKIRYVIIPHGHPDHYGGAKFLQQTFGAKVVAPRNDEATLRFYAARVTTTAPDKIDILVEDGSKLSLGGVTVDFHEVPGHTPGGVVMSFPVTEGGKPHRMLIWASGGATPAKLDDLNAQIPALQRLLDRTTKAHVDALADNHGSHQLTASWPVGGPNPFLIGQADVSGYLTMRLECDQARVAAKP